MRQAASLEVVKSWMRVDGATLGMGLVFFKLIKMPTRSWAAKAPSVRPISSKQLEFLPLILMLSKRLTQIGMMFMFSKALLLPIILEPLM